MDECLCVLICIFKYMYIHGLHRNVDVYVFACVCTYTQSDNICQRAGMGRHVCMCVCVHVCTRVRVCVHVCMHVCVSACVCACVCLMCVSVCTTRTV